MAQVITPFRHTGALLLLLIAATLGTPTPGIAADVLFTGALVNLDSTKAGGAVMGMLSPGVALKVLQSSGRRMKVSITGWSPEGGAKYLFSKIGQRIRLAKLTDAGQSQRRVIAQKQDYYENTWQQVRLTGWVDQKGTESNVAAVWQRASALFHKRCTRCHALHRPTEFKANQWPAILKIMTVRAGLSPSDKALVTQFLQTYAKDQSGAPALKEVAADSAASNPTVARITGDAVLAAKGAALFDQDGCSACHGADAATPVLPAYPRLAGQNADYVYKQLHDFQTGARSNDQDGIMKDTIANVPDADLRAISYWLSTLHS